MRMLQVVGSQVSENWWAGFNRVSYPTIFK
jgi:hypothetical protein